MRKSLKVIIVLILILLPSDLKVLASNISISPEKILNTNFEAKDVDLKILNSSDYPITLNVNVASIDSLQNNTIVFSELGEFQRSRLTFDEQITINSNEVHDFNLKIIHNFTRPFNFAVVFTEQTGVQDQTTAIGKIMIPVLISGKGRVLGISTGQNLFVLDTNSIYTQNIIEFDIDITNTSTENIIPLGVASIKNKFGFINESSQDYNQDQRIVLADSTRTLGDRIELSGLNFGIATLKIDLLYGSSNTVYTLERDIIIVPGYFIVLVIAVIIATVILRRKFYAKNK